MRTFEYSINSKERFYISNCPARLFFSCLDPALPIRVTKFYAYDAHSQHYLEEVNQVTKAGNMAAYLTFIPDAVVNVVNLKLRGLTRVKIHDDDLMFVTDKVTVELVAFLKELCTRLGYPNATELLNIIGRNYNTAVLITDQGELIGSFE